MKAYQSFLKDAGTPIGVVGSIGLGVWFVVQAMAWLFATPSNESAWAMECEQLAVGNTILVEKPKMGGQRVCMMLVPIEEHPIFESSITEWKATCAALGGTYRTLNTTYTCYRKEMVEELGAQETYGETP